MKMTELFLAELERELPATRRVLERVPEGRNDWKPHEKSMAMGYLAALVASMGQGHAVRLDPIYNAPVRPPVRADGSSVFAVKRESVPLGFILLQRDVRTCTLLPATLVITRIKDGKLTRVRSRNLSIAGCRYAYDLKPNRLGVGMKANPEGWRASRCPQRIRVRSRLDQAVVWFGISLTMPTAPC